ALAKLVVRFGSVPGRQPPPEAVEAYRAWSALYPKRAPLRLPLIRRDTPAEAGFRLERMLTQFLSDVPLTDEVRSAVRADYAAADAAAARGDYRTAIAALERAIDRIE